MVFSFLSNTAISLDFVLFPLRPSWLSHSVTRRRKRRWVRTRSSTASWPEEPWSWPSTPSSPETSRRLRISVSRNLLLPTISSLTIATTTPLISSSKMVMVRMLYGHFLTLISLLFDFGIFRAGKIEFQLYKWLDLVQWRLSFSYLTIFAFNFLLICTKSLGEIEFGTVLCCWFCLVADFSLRWSELLCRNFTLRVAIKKIFLETCSSFQKLAKNLELFLKYTWPNKGKC